jgi:2-iminobutanoate/2-iminopropanoate deaminase
MSQPSRTVVHTADAPAAIGPYSQAVVANGFVFCSGQIPLDPTTGQLVGDDARAQTRRVMENLRGVLAAAGAGFETVVKSTIFLADLGDFGVVNAIYAEYFPSDPPARATVQVARLPRDARVEIEMVATVRGA